MLALRWSFAKDLALVAILGAMTLAADVEKHGARHATPPRMSVRVELRTAPPQAPVIDLASAACAEAELHYQHREFALAAAALRRAVASDPGLEAHAQLYDQLGRAWDHAAAPGATPIDRYEALRFARRLDVSLGGAYASELDGRLRIAAPVAARAYGQIHDRDGVELALGTCDALGVR